MLAIYVYQLNIWLIFEKHVAEFHVYFFKRSLFLESLYLHLKRSVSGKETNINEQVSPRWSKHIAVIYPVCTFCERSCYKRARFVSVPLDVGGLGVTGMKRGGCEGLWVRGNEYVSLISLQIHTWDDSNDDGVWWPLLSSVAHCFPSWRKMSDQCLFENYLNKECLVPLLLFYLYLLTYVPSLCKEVHWITHSASNIIYVHFTN